MVCAKKQNHKIVISTEAQRRNLRLPVQFDIYTTMPELNLILILWNWQAEDEAGADARLVGITTREATIGKVDDAPVETWEER